MGSGLSSPSENAPDLAATLKATIPTLGGVLTAKVKFVPEPALTEKLFLTSFGASPKSASRLFLLSASTMSNVSVPCMGLSDALLTTTLSCA